MRTLFPTATRYHILDFLTTASVTVDFFTHRVLETARFRFWLMTGIAFRGLTFIPEAIFPQSRCKEQTTGNPEIEAASESWLKWTDIPSVDRAERLLRLLQ